jgi:hypothetical protein
MFTEASKKSENYTPMQSNREKSVYTETLCFTIDDEKHAHVPQSFKDVTRKLSKFMNNAAENPCAIQDFPGSASFKYVTGYIYPPEGKLVGHCDNIPYVAPAISSVIEKNVK